MSWGSILHLKRKFAIKVFALHGFKTSAIIRDTDLHNCNSEKFQPSHITLYCSTSIRVLEIFFWLSVIWTDYHLKFVSLDRFLSVQKISINIWKKKNIFEFPKQAFLFSSHFYFDLTVLTLSHFHILVPHFHILIYHINYFNFPPSLIVNFPLVLSFISFSFCTPHADLIIV